ncbi:Aste57867_17593 [Aphanomyces stellatus]|uniref:Aste57867_17593 protein n=1 Tax=Aphanomyces stellatus TaxID=120398 RepID=A0A485L819_9STRA|nr:hypothetical protein As57867_017533 [Aphanomyces stellatus]VFT94344.1 Aste57867_17593 [Aphanomyces stellatus]
MNPHARLARTFGAAAIATFAAHGTRHSTTCEASAPTQPSDVPPPSTKATPSLWRFLGPLQQWLESGDADATHFASFSSKHSNAGLMSWPSLQRGLAQRVKDEAAFVALAAEAKAAVAANDRAKLAAMPARFAEAAYGHGITNEMRELHVAQYGCVQYTSEVLTSIASVAASCRGVVELGAGHGQWAKQLREEFQVDIIAFDNMVRLPLRGASAPHAPASRHVLKGDEAVLLNRRLNLEGRALLLVFPDPGTMAAKSLLNYMQASPKNDVLIYVGEGRCGANANAAFFDLLELNSEWVLEQMLPVVPFGTKGFERYFVFRRRQPVV